MKSLFDIDNWREIGATLGRNKTRTFLTAFGVFWGTAMLAMLLGGAGGLRGLLMRNFDGIATNMAGLFPETTTMSYKGFNKGMTWQLTQRDLDAITAAAPAIEYHSGITMGGGTATYADKSLQASVLGVEPDYFKVTPPILLSGRLFNESDVLSGEKVGLIGKDVASSLFGNADPLGRIINAGGVYIKVIGVLTQRSDVSIGGNINENILMPISTMRRAWGMGDNIGFAVITMKKGHTLSEVKPTVMRVISSNHTISPDDEQAIGYMDVAQMFEQIEGLFLVVSLLAAFVGAGTLIAGIIGVGNIMWIIVKERTREIGIRRAIGAHPRDIISQILSEGVVLTLIAGLAGITFATIVLAIVDYATASPTVGSAGFELTFTKAVAIMLVFTLFGSLAGLIPAVKAMKIKPIEAINDK